MASVIKCAGCGRCVRTLKNGYEKELLELQKWGKRDNCLFCKNCMKSMEVKNEKEKIQ